MPLHVIKEYRITTTGLTDPVVFPELGNRSFAHPTTDYNLLSEYSLFEILGAQSVRDAITAGDITVSDQDGVDISDVTNKQHYHINQPILDSVTLANITDFTINAGRNSNNITNSYLNNASGSVTNLTPYILPFNCTLSFISASTNGAETWDLEVHLNNVLVPGAVLSMVAVDYNYGTYTINFNAGDKVSIYCKGTGVNNPNGIIVFKGI